MFASGHREVRRLTDRLMPADGSLLGEGGGTGATNHSTESSAAMFARVQRTIRMARRDSGEGNG